MRETSLAGRRAGRPAQRREVHALQPDYARRGGPSSPPCPARPATCIAQPVDLGRRRVLARPTAAACTAPARTRCTTWCTSRGAASIESADLLVLVVDGRQGRAPGDDEIVQALRATRRADHPRHQQDGRPAGARRRDGAVPARHRPGRRDLGRARPGDRRPARRDRATAAGRRAGAAARRGPRGGGEPRRAGRRLAHEADPAPREIGVAIIGRPNVGKSSLVNRLLREERVLVSDMPGTTRDAVDSLLRWHRRDFRIVDTAGIRRPGGWRGRARWSRSACIIARRAVEAADVAVVVIDAIEGATEQDGAIAGEAETRRLRHHRRGQQVGPGQGGGPGLRRRRSTTRCGGG